MSEILKKYNLILLSLIPVSFLFGPSISLINTSLIALSSLLIITKKKFHFLIKEKVIIGLLIFYFYLIFNSLISIDYKEGILRNVSFFRFILLFIAINFLFFLDFKKLGLFPKFWLITISIVLFDVIIEIIFGKNLLGYEAPENRVVSFFKDEPNVAGFLNGFIFVIFGYLLTDFLEKKKSTKFLIFSFILICFLCIVFTFERSNTIKFLLGMCIFFYLNNTIKLKFKILISSAFIFSMMLIFLNSSYFKIRYGDDFILQIINKDKREFLLNQNRYILLYKNGLTVFKNYPLLGVGNKNYRIEVCGGVPASHLHRTEKLKYNTLACTTHPHQIYLEFLAEHGAFGTILILSILFYFIFKNLKVIILSRNLIQLGSFSYLVINFVPLIPTGAFFSDFNATLFWLNFALLYAANPKTNIFNKGR